ncbi:MAG: ABC transporter permease [Gordonia sp. (in: high G+C Gram-positive bacteria)]
MTRPASAPTTSAPTASRSPRSEPGTLSTIALVAQREIRTRATTRSFLISTGLLIVVIIVGAIVWSALTGGGPDTTKIGVTGATTAISAALEQTGAAAGTPIDAITVGSEADARQRVDDEDLDAALAPGPAATSFVVISRDGLDPDLTGLLHAAVEQAVQARALAERGVEPGSLPHAELTGIQTNPQRSDEGQRTSIALIGSMLLMIAVMTGGSMVAVGVVEEKTSRIVEILLATVKPLHLLWGKIIGIGAIALAQVVLLGATALIAGIATGLLTIAGTALTMFGAVIAWFILGFLFFAILYGATGALVARQEELNSASAPLTMLALAAIYSGTFGVAALDSTLISVLSWIPPFSAVLMPIRIATGDTDTLQVVATFGIMIVVCALATWMSARIYERSILRTGSRVRWSEVLRLMR